MSMHASQMHNIMHTITKDPLCTVQITTNTQLNVCNNFHALGTCAESQLRRLKKVLNYACMMYLHSWMTNRGIRT